MVQLSLIVSFKRKIYNSNLQWSFSNINVMKTRKNNFNSNIIRMVSAWKTPQHTIPPFSLLLLTQSERQISSVRSTTKYPYYLKARNSVQHKYCKKNFVPQTINKTINFFICIFPMLLKLIFPYESIWSNYKEKYIEKL